MSMLRVLSRSEWPRIVCAVFRDSPPPPMKSLPQGTLLGSGRDLICIFCQCCEEAGLTNLKERRRMS
jgi:hypothetical protein